MEVAIWHGQSASDQLMLRRVVFHLYQTPQRINEVAMDLRELETPAHGSLTAIGMYSAAAWRATDRAGLGAAPGPAGLRVAAERQGKCRRAAVERQHAGAGGLPHRRRRDPGARPADWTPAAQVVGSVMGAIEGLLASDWFVFWRCRELVSTGQLVLRGNPEALDTCEIRRNSLAADA
jgi:hypothetical protein